MNDKYLTLNENEIIDIENKLRYCFKDKRLLCKAFTHSSFTNENKSTTSNERLEFLGDRIVNFLCAKELFFSVGGNEGKLTELLINKVSKEPLSLSIQKLGIFKYLKKSKGASFLGTNPKAESDLYEAIIAAIYVDSQSLEPCEVFIKQTLVDVEIIDYISLFKIYCEQHDCVKFSEATIEHGNNGEFMHTITVNGSIFNGIGQSKYDAKRQAAKKACEFLKI